MDEKSKIIDWIGGSEYVNDFTDGQAHELLNWLEENEIDIEVEDDIRRANDKLAEYIN